MLVRWSVQLTDKSKVIQPNTPKFLPAMKDGSSKNRLGRQVVNRQEKPAHPSGHGESLLADHFWQGISDTPSDFGSQGKWPTHPDLLNWLAADFIESDWDVKRAIRQLVTSATYRQSSVTTEEHGQRSAKSLFRPGSLPHHGRICATRPCMSVDCSTKNLAVPA